MMYSRVQTREPTHRSMSGLGVEIRSMTIKPSSLPYKLWSGTSYNALVNIFECIGNVLKRLKIYIMVPLTPTMIERLIKIMFQLLSVLALATKHINQGRFSMYIPAYNHS